MEPQPNPGIEQLLASFFGVVVRGSSYRNLVYLWLGFPLGLAYFVLLAVGLSLGAGLIVLWLGLLVWLLTLGIASGCISLERFLAAGLLGAPIARPAPAAPAESGIVARLGAFLSRPSLWKGLVFLALKLPLGLAGWVVSLVSLSVATSLAAAPLIYLLGGTVDLGFWWVDGWVQVGIVSLIGLVGLLLTFHLNNGIAFVWRKLSEWLLAGDAAPAAAAAGALPAAA